MIISTALKKQTLHFYIAYHPDYLGHTEFVSDANGDAYQYFWYSPFGDAIVEEHANTASFSSRFLFNAKEFDPETGRYYYGARYYDPGLSLWLSVDPWADKYPNVTPYNFVENNPINLIDPDGNGPTGIPTNPKQMFYQGWGQMFQSVARTVDNVIGTVKGWFMGGVKTSATTQTTVKASVTVTGNFEQWATPDFFNNTIPTETLDALLDVRFGVDVEESVGADIATPYGEVGVNHTENLSSGESSDRISYSSGKSGIGVFIEQVEKVDGSKQTNAGVQVETEQHIGPLILGAGAEWSQEIK